MYVSGDTATTMFHGTVLCPIFLYFCSQNSTTHRRRDNSICVLASNNHVLRSYSGHMTVSEDCSNPVAPVSNARIIHGCRKNLQCMK